MQCKFQIYRKTNILLFWHARKEIIFQHVKPGKMENMMRIGLDMAKDQGTLQMCCARTETLTNFFENKNYE